MFGQSQDLLMPHPSYNKNCREISMPKKVQERLGRSSNSQDQKIVKEKTIDSTKKKVRSGRPTKRKNKQIKNGQQSSLNQGQDQESSQNFSIEAGIILIHNLIDFFSSIGEQRGFVFKPRQRQQLSKCISQIKFTQESQWFKEQEIDKIRSVCQLYQCNSQSLRKLMLESSTIFAKQFTVQHYLIILKVYIIMRDCLPDDKQKQELLYLARRIHENQDNQFLFFSLIYQSRIKTRYSRPALQPYQKLIKEISNILRKYIIYEDKDP